MGLADEIMQQIEEYALLREQNIRGRTRQRHREGIRSRLTALETELAGYRKETAIIPDSEPRISARSGMALPCTSEYVNAQSGYTGETGG